MARTFYCYGKVFKLGLSPKAKLVYIYLCRMADRSAVSFPSRKTIAGACIFPIKESVILKNFTCCFTGHRNLPATKIEKIVVNLGCEVDTLIANGVTDFISGGALGFDQIAASLIIAKKEMGKNIRLIFALPCKNQDEKWNEQQKNLLRELLPEAGEVVYISEEYNDFCMRRRNYYMVEQSDYCICALLQEKSGTSQTVRYAKKKGLQIINVVK